MSLLDKINNKTALGAVVGLGYVGLPLLCEFAKSGFKAIGIDVDANKIDYIKKGVSYIKDVTDSELNELVQSGNLTATSDYSVLKDADIVSICVPTPLRKSKSPDISYIVAACSEVSKYLHSGQLIILESTTYPGTTQEIVLPILSGSFLKEEFAEICATSVLAEMRRQFTENEFSEKRNFNKDNKLTVGKDYFLAFSPERVDPGNLHYKTKDIPKVIGGHTSLCSNIAAEFYKKIFPQVVPVSSTRSAEMVKLLENTFRNVNIALANEMSLMSESLGVDIWEVINAAATKPFGFMPFYPGPGLGGHCIPIDPVYLTWKARMNGFDPKFIELANEFNQKMPRKVIYKIQDKLNGSGKSIKNSNVLVIGVAYKKDVSDTRESPAIEIIKMLNEKGASVSYYDPHVRELKTDNLNMITRDLTKEILEESDCVAILTDHSCVDYDLIKNNCRVIVDTRNALKQSLVNSH